jgi:hypothetical protein
MIKYLLNLMKLKTILILKHNIYLLLNRNLILKCWRIKHLMLKNKDLNKGYKSWMGVFNNVIKDVQNWNKQ